MENEKQISSTPMNSKVADMLLQLRDCQGVSNSNLVEENEVDIEVMFCSYSKFH